MPYHDTSFIDPAKLALIVLTLVLKWDGCVLHCFFKIQHTRSLLRCFTLHWKSTSSRTLIVANTCKLSGFTWHLWKIKLRGICIFFETFLFYVRLVMYFHVFRLRILDFFSAFRLRVFPFWLFSHYWSLYSFFKIFIVFFISCSKMICQLFTEYWR